MSNKPFIHSTAFSSRAVISSKKCFKIKDLNDLFNRLPALEKNDLEEFEKEIKKIRALMQIKNNSQD